MRITPVQADVNVSADYPTRGVPAAAFQSGYATAGLEIASGAEAIGKIYEKKAAQDAQAEAILLQSQAELALQNHDAALKSTETDAGKYLEQRRKAFQDVVQQVSTQAKNPGTQRVFNTHMSRSLVGLDEKALTYAADLTKKNEVAQLQTTLDNYDTQLSAVDPQDTEEITRIGGLKTAAIQIRAASLGVDKANAMVIAERKKSTEEIAYRDMRQNPFTFTDHLDRYRGMDGEKLQKIVTQAETYQEHLTRESRLETERHDKEIQGLVDHWHENNVGMLEKGALDHTPTALQQIEFYGPEGLNVLKPGEYLRLRTLAAKEPVLKSDGATLRSVVAGVAAYPPTMSVKQITALNEQKLLSDEDMKTYANRARDLKTTVPESEKHDYQMVKEISNRLLTKRKSATDMIDTDESAALKARMDMALLNRSQYHGGKEQSRDVMYAVLPGLVQQSKGQQVDQIKNQQNALANIPYKTRDALDAAFQAKKINKKTYDDAAQLMDALKYSIDQYQTFTRESEALFRENRRQ